MNRKSYFETLIASAKRELALRRNVYPKHLAAGRMTKAEADRETAATVEIISVLEQLHDSDFGTWADNYQRIASAARALIACPASLTEDRKSCIIPREVVKELVEALDLAGESVGQLQPTVPRIKQVPQPDLFGTVAAPAPANREGVPPPDRGDRFSAIEFFPPGGMP